MKQEQTSFQITGQIVNLLTQKIFPGKVVVRSGVISQIIQLEDAPQQIVMPGLIDAHVHIECTMLLPSTFARLAVVHGTVATVSDPHQMGNVCGIPGVQYMIQNGKKVPFKFYFGAPCCVPATKYETSGAIIGADDLQILMSNPQIKYMSQMMDYPGVINKDPEVMEKINIAKKYNKPIDGHAPGIMGEQVGKYIQAGITTDHQTYLQEEAVDKMKYGMKIIIRQGSVARNFDTLIGLFQNNSQSMMFCTDEDTPNKLAKGHMNIIVKRAIQRGYDPLKVLKSCIVNPIRHYNLDVGILQKGDPADMIVIDNFSNFNVKKTFINGILVAENGVSKIPHFQTKILNNFSASKVQAKDFQLSYNNKDIRVIGLVENQLYTKALTFSPKVINNKMVSDVERDILKVAVINRYSSQSKPFLGFIHNFGIKHGAVASTIGHDSHNLIVVGVTDQDMAIAINSVIETKGGISVVDQKGEIDILPLPVGGLMSNEDPYQVGKSYQRINAKARKIGGKCQYPFMILGFVTCLVIPQLKISDKCLFNGTAYQPTLLEVE